MVEETLCSNNMCLHNSLRIARQMRHNSLVDPQTPGSSRKARETHNFRLERPQIARLQLPEDVHIPTRKQEIQPLLLTGKRGMNHGIVQNIIVVQEVLLLYPGRQLARLVGHYFQLFVGQVVIAPRRQMVLRGHNVLFQP